jgi:hypothetical protein
MSFQFEVNDSVEILKAKEFLIKGIKNSQKKDVPQIPFKHILIMGEGDDKPIVKIQKEWIEHDLDYSFIYGQGENCRCRVNKLYESVEAKSFNLSDELEYIGDYRGQNLYRYSIPLVKNIGKTSHISNLKLELIKGSVFKSGQSLSKQDSGKSLVIVLPENFLDQKILIENYYLNKGFGVSFIQDKSTISNREDLFTSLKDKYLAERTTHVIFIGNSKYIRPFYVETKFDNSTPSDYPYFKFGGTDDMFPDVIGARISVSDSEELVGIFNKMKNRKTLSKELNVIGIASNEGSNPSDKDYVRSIIKDLDFSGENILLYQNEGRSNADFFVSKLNEGVDFISYVGHGSGYSWPSFNQEVNVSDLKNWEVNEKMPIVVDVACQNGNFDGRGRIGETMIHGHKEYNYRNGAISYVGGSVDISWNPPAIFAQGISKALGKDHSMSIGDGVLEGHKYLLEMHHDLDDILDNFEWTHLQGDPTASIR